MKAEYPQLLYCDGDLELIHSSPSRYRLLKGNTLVATFKSLHVACKYIVDEFNQEIDLADL